MESQRVAVKLTLSTTGMPRCTFQQADLPPSLPACTASMIMAKSELEHNLLFYWLFPLFFICLFPALQRQGLK